MFDLSAKKIFVAGHRGMVGSALLRLLEARGCSRLLRRTRQELDLTDSYAVRDFFSQERPQIVFLAGAKVGGILANSTFPAEFIHQNLLIQDNIIHNAYLTGVERLLFLGSSCIYPRDCPQPIREEYLLTGPLESTNEPYGVAKIAGIITCQAYNRQYGTSFLSVMPTNLYGPNDNFDLETSHVLPALIRKFDEAKKNGAGQATVWGSGRPRREFLHVDDLADACLFLMQLPETPFARLCLDQIKRVINIGTGTDLTIAELAETVKKIVGFSGEICYDASRPDGTPRKVLDISHLNELGWRPQISLESGISAVYQWYLETRAKAASS